MVPQGACGGGAILAGRFQAAALRWIALGPVQRQPNGLESVGVGGVARKQMPVQVGHLVAEQLVIHFLRGEAGLDGASEKAHFIQMGAALGVIQAAQFGGVGSRDEEAITVVILPRPQ